MARPRKTTDAPDTVARLRATALEHFGRQGFLAASLGDIAAECGVTRTTLLYHFESKEKLYNAVVQEAFTKVASVLLSSMTRRGDFRLRIRRMIRLFLQHVETNPTLAKLMVREVIDERGPGCAIIVDQGMPVLAMVEAFVLKEGHLRPDQQPLLREILLAITTSVMLKSASGAMQETFWGPNARTGELASLLLDSILGPES